MRGRGPFRGETIGRDSEQFNEQLPKGSRHSGGKTSKGAITVEGIYSKVFNKRIHRVPRGSVYIGRPSPWGNPFVIGKDGTREEVIQKYKEYLLANPELVERAKQELKGKHLVCYCAPHACHGEVLLRLVNEGERLANLAKQAAEEARTGVIHGGTEGLRRALREGLTQR